jgi:hypothetical protein
MWRFFFIIFNIRKFNQKIILRNNTEEDKRIKSCYFRSIQLGLL